MAMMIHLDTLCDLRRRTVNILFLIFIRSWQVRRARRNLNYNGGKAKSTTVSTFGKVRSTDVNPSTFEPLSNDQMQTMLFKNKQRRRKSLT